MFTNVAGRIPRLTGPRKQQELFRLQESHLYGREVQADPRSLIAPEAAKSANAISSFIPLLAVGIPGSATTTAVLLSALLQTNIDPGQALCHSHPEIIREMIGSMYFGNLLLFIAHIR